MNILDILFPKHCLSCSRFGKYFCDHCVSTIRTIGTSEAVCPMCERLAFRGLTHPRCKTKYSLDGLISIFHYDGIIKQAVKSLKYRRITDLAKEFVGLMPDNLSNHASTICHPREGGDPVFVPIPLHALRFRDRGFNQAEVLGRLLAHQLHIPIRIDILKRVMATPPQVEMKDKKERLQNMKNVFSVDHTMMKPSSSVLLFDDVFTTGATMRAAGETLKRAGATSVWAVTMAR